MYRGGLAGQHWVQLYRQTYRQIQCWAAMMVVVGMVVVLMLMVVMVVMVVVMVGRIIQINILADTVSEILW